MSEIKPRIVDNEPVCSGEECPACESVADIHRTLVCSVLGRVAPSGRTCVEGLRRQRDALQAVAGKVLEILRANQILLGVIPGASLELEHMPEAVEVLIRSVVQVGQMADANAKAFNAAMQERDALAHEVAHPADAEELRTLKEERDEALARVREMEKENDQARDAQVTIGQIFTFLYQPDWKELIEAVREAHDALNTTRKAGR